MVAFPKEMENTGSIWRNQTEGDNGCEDVESIENSITKLESRFRWWWCWSWEVA